MSSDTLDTDTPARADLLRLNHATHSSDGIVPFYRGEIFVDESELNMVNRVFSQIECVFGRPCFIEVKSPPLIIPPVYTTLNPPMAVSLPVRSTRVSFPIHVEPPRTSGGKSTRASGHETTSKVESAQIKAEPQFSNPGDVSPGAKVSGEVPMIPVNSARIYKVIEEVFAQLEADGDYTCLFAEYLPHGVTPSITLTSIRERVASRAYSDHFVFCDDLVALSAYWLQGPPTPNPLLPQYIASLKLIRQGTDLMMSKAQELSNEDYYTGPDVEAAIKEDIKREQVTRKSSVVSSTSFARKVRRTDSTGSASKSSELKSIEEQVTMLTQHVMGLQQNNNKGKNAVSQARASSASSLDSRPLSADEIRRLEADLMKMSPDDIDFLVTSMLKDEPSVRIDDESYELDVAALPASKQRAIRRFVTRRLNLVDPSHEAQKLKQILKQDELAKASEEMAERLLAAASMPLSSVPGKVISPAEDSEAERQRVERERKRDEEARRLWKLAHGGEDDDPSEQMDIEQ